ncbi:GNAT family N-acetyltransferase [Thiosocius teredinicola]|uniref:GNAT family N-acetyltransferase n=1 Tax=Thiosocius teredinicola TaxID=1973002 RepID=UPI000990C71B
MKVKLAQTERDIDRISPVMRELRPAYSHEDLVAQIEKQQAFGYQLAFVELGDAVICVAGFVIGHKLAWGKHIYIDDLVTAEAHRSSGAGGLLIDWFKRYAAEQGCGQIHLDSGVQRFGAHRFYLREGFDINSHHFAISDLDQAGARRRS